MSKAVKSIGRAVKKVVSGVSKVVKGVVSGIKKFASSKFGKIIIAAAAIYFGGAAIMGAMGGASAGTGFLGTISGAIQGAGAGISSAWTGLTGAASSLMAGELGAAGSALSSGFTGAYGAGSSAVSGALGSAAGSAASGSGGVLGMDTASANVLKTGVVPSSAPSSGGLWNSLGDYGKMAAIQGGTQLIGGVMQGYGQQKAVEEQQGYEAQQRAQAAANAGSPLWGSVPTDTTGGAYSRTAEGGYDPLAESRRLADLYSGMNPNPAMLRGQYGLISAGMGPITNNNFPVYNPYYYRG